MKKLFLNIQKVHIKGKDPSVLSTLVADIDKQMQSLVIATDEARALMSKYNGNNNGAQYEKASATLHELSRHIRECTVVVNDLEMQVVAFQNKVFRFEGSNRAAPMPKKFIATETKAITSHVDLQYGMDEMRAVATGLSKYCEKTRSVIKGILMARSRISTVWVDPQFKDFAAVIENVRVVTERHVKELDVYVTYLNTRIKEMLS